MVRTTKMLSAVYLPTRRLHAVWALGGPADGSLYNFYTLCKRRIENPDRWHEIDSRRPYDYMGLGGTVHHCLQCQRIIDKDV
jgi:hypothetical protein